MGVGWQHAFIVTLCEEVDECALPVVSRHERVSMWTLRYACNLMSGQGCIDPMIVSYNV